MKTVEEKYDNLHIVFFYKEFVLKFSSKIVFLFDLKAKHVFPKFVKYYSS